MLEFVAYFSIDAAVFLIMQLVVYLLDDAIGWFEVAMSIYQMESIQSNILIFAYFAFYFLKFRKERQFDHFPGWLFFFVLIVQKLISCWVSLNFILMYTV